MPGKKMPIVTGAQPGVGGGLAEGLLSGGYNAAPHIASRERIADFLAPLDSCRRRNPQPKNRRVDRGRGDP
jgi:hypothetical protein